MNQRYSKRLKRDCQRAAFPVPMSRGGYVGVIEFGVMRCQPLRRAFYIFRRLHAQNTQL